MFRMMLVFLVVFAAAAYGQKGLSIDEEKVFEATGFIQMPPDFERDYVASTATIWPATFETHPLLIEIADPEKCIYKFSIGGLVLSATDIADLSIKLASLEVEVKSQQDQINQLSQQINGAAGELKRLTFLLQDKETELANLFQLLKQFSEEIDKSKTAEEKEKLLQSLQQTIFNVLFNNTRKGLSK